MFLMFHLRNYEASHFSVTVVTNHGCAGSASLNQTDRMLLSPFISVCAPVFSVYVNVALCYALSVTPHYKNGFIIV